MKTNFWLLLVTCVALYSCNQSAENTKTDDSIEVDSIGHDTLKSLDSTSSNSSNEISLTPLKGSSEFQDASLQLNLPEQNAVLASPVVTFKYDIKNYNLKSQTPHSNCNQCNNSKDGQHIHLILNNAPYIAIYEPEFKDTLKEGHYVALSFLSRSYHESIKEFQAFDLRQFTVGKVKTNPIDLTQPLLFYSRPKGEYTGESTKKILLDFYLVNTDLSPDGNKVKITINGKEFLSDNWQPYIIEGLPMGKSIVKIELVNQEGKVINDKINRIEREIILK